MGIKERCNEKENILDMGTYQPAGLEHVSLLVQFQSEFRQFAWAQGARFRECDQ